MANINPTGANFPIAQQAVPGVPEQKLGGGVHGPIIQPSVNTEGKGTEVQTKTDFNTFGKDIANFANFKGNDKNDAMRITQTAANDVKKAYMQLQHEYPGVTLSFEPMPDPKTCGKKREGFFNYQQQLDDWKDFAMTQIANAREMTTADGFKAVIANDNNNALTISSITANVGAAIIENSNENTAILYQQGEEIRVDVKDESAATRRAVHAEADKTREAVYQEGAAIRENTYNESEWTRNVLINQNEATRRTVRNEGAKTRDKVSQTARQTQELDGISEKITTNMSSGEHLQSTMNRINNMRNRILQSNMPFDAKKEALTHLASFSTQTYISGRELEAEEKRIASQIR